LSHSETLNVGKPKTVREKDVWLEGYTPVFVSVASKGFSFSVSFLFATLAGRAISVAAKGVREEESQEGMR